MMRAFRSELPKLQRWSVLGGGAAIILFSGFIPFFLLSQITSGAVGPGTMVPRWLPSLLQTDRGLAGLLGGGGPAPVIIAIVLILVTANVASEWSQGTLRNLLVAEPGRLRLLAGKMLALLLFMVVVEALAIAVGAGVALLTARVDGISTTLWTSGQGVRNFLSLLGNSLLTMTGLSLLSMLIAVVTAVLTRSAAAAVGLALAYALAVEALLGAVWSGGAKWLPINVFDDLPSINPNISHGSAIAVALLWMLGFAVVSAVIFRRTDVTA